MTIPFLIAELSHSPNSITFLLLILGNGVVANVLLTQVRREIRRKKQKDMILVG